MTGVYSRARHVGSPGTAPRLAVFLDRDGVVVEDVNYLHRPEDIRYLGDALGAIVSLNESGIPVVLVTNQSGIGRGYYGWPEFEAIQDRMERDLAARGGWLDGVWACAHHAEGVGEFAVPDSPHRKPNPGMLRDAASSLAINLSSSWMVGDKSCDIEAAWRAGLRGAIHVATGHGATDRPKIVETSHRLASAGLTVSFSKDLVEAVELVLQTASSQPVVPQTVLPQIAPARPKLCLQNRES